MFFRISFPILLLTSISLAALTVYSPSRHFIRENILARSRKVLAKADADLTGKGDRVTVIKVQTAESLALEVYRLGSDPTTSQLIKRIPLPDHRDGYFTFRGNATNLAITDVDGDHLLDLVAPTFDDSLIPRLNVFRYDADAKDFIKMSR
jgi:hypothetical protein